MRREIPSLIAFALSGLIAFGIALIWTNVLQAVWWGVMAGGVGMTIYWRAVLHRLVSNHTALNKASYLQGVMAGRAEFKKQLRQLFEDSAVHADVHGRRALKPEDRETWKLHEGRCRDVVAWCDQHPESSRYSPPEFRRPPVA